MRVYAIDGSARKKWNTSTVLEAALEGAAEAADDVLTERVNLYDIDYKGCISCMQCKRLGGPSYGKCAVRDGLTPVLANTLEADVVIFGSPIYFSDVTAMTRAFWERLLFPCFTYTKNYASIAPKKIRTAIFYTMNATPEQMEVHGYVQRLKHMETFIGNAFGYPPKILYVNNTLQVEDYSKYKLDIFSETEKKKWREEHFGADCEAAKKIGAELVGEAAK